MGVAPQAIRVAELVPHTRSAVWKALTDRRLMATWLMPNDFALETGHAFTVRIRPAPSMRSVEVARCEVLDYQVERMLRIAWRSRSGHDDGLDSRVTFTLEHAGTGTWLVVEQTGFDPTDVYQGLSQRHLATVWPGIGERLSMAIRRSQG